MKKVLSVLLSVIFTLTGLSTGVITALANNKNDAEALYLNGYANAVVSTSQKFYVEFEPTASGYYEFLCLSPSTSSDITACLEDYEGEVYMQAMNDSANPYMIAAAELAAGKSYYYVLESSGSYLSTAVTVRYHSHVYSTLQNYPAVYDANDSMLCEDGASYYLCDYCGEMQTAAVYYYAGKMSLKTKTFTYNGKAKKTTVSVYDRLGNKLPSDQYTVSYKNNKKPGYATVTVTLKGNYSGTLSAKMTVKPKKATLNSVKSTKKKKATIKWKKDTTVTGYSIQYSTSKKFTKKTTKTVTVKSKKKTSKTISKLKSKKKYYIRIREYKQSGGKKIYGAWSKTKTVKIK